MRRATDPKAALVEARPSAPIPAIAGRYRVLEQLGTGGVGVVYRVRDEAGGASLALKQLLSSQAGSRKRKLETLFEREYHTLARLKHPCIIEVYEYGLTESGPYYTMELLGGGDLQQHAPLPWRDVCRHMCDVASSLALLHAHRMVHRDITPRNIRLTSDGRAKLIDFGALSSFGPALDVVGTPLCMAPEVFQRGALDQRSDLFALGVVAYYALTGKHAFPARNSEELPELWRHGPVPPLQLVAELPAQLNELVLSLLHPDPLSRPLHAAQVIDQCCAIAGLAVGDSELAAESYLASGRLVGRAAEQEWMERRISSALAGHGNEVLVAGAPGVGKTRMLHEIALDAQLLGALVLRGDAQATTGYFGLVVRLAVELLERGGAVARTAAQAHAGLLVHIAPELRERFPGVEPDTLPPQAAEQRARFQAALLAWFGAVATEQALLVLVDNVHIADESSAAFLVALGSDAATKKLLLVCSQRSGDASVAPQPISVLRARSALLKLETLNAGACDELVQSLFGDVANSARLAKLLFEKSGGNPQHCMELARLLARTHVAKYVAGTWVLPTLVSSAELPDRLEDVLAAKLASLNAAARGLAEALCLHSKPISLEHCIAFADGLTEADSHAALDTLLSEQILICTEGRYQFAQQLLRNRLMESLPSARAQALHRRAASVLEGTDVLELRMQRGWHLLRAGEELAGADLLANTSRAFINTASAREESQSVIAALCAALEVYERHQRSPHERAALLFPLVLLCYYCPQHHLILRYAPEALRLGREITGLGFAHKLQRLVGKERALQMGMRRAGLRFERERKRGLQLTLPQAIASFSALVPASMGAFGCHYDTEGAEALGRIAEPLSLFEDDKLPALIYKWMQAQVHMVRGLEGEAHSFISNVLAQMNRPAIREALGDAHWRSLRGGAMFILGLVTCYRGSPAACEIADDMERTGIRLWALVADQVRLLHHGYRGESARVHHYRERVERSAMLGGPTWHTELFWPAAMLHGEVLCGDTIAVRRTFQQLERTAQEVPTLRVQADSARAAYLSLRGDHAQALELYERVTEKLTPRHSVAWLPVRGQFAQALNRAGEHARAKQLLYQTLEHVTEADRGVRVLCFEVRRQLAVALAALGDSTPAIALLEAMFNEYREDENPLLLGLLHETRAQCALSVGDRAGFDRNFEQADARLRSTRNPVLIARISQLKLLAVAHSEPAPFSLSALGTPITVGSSRSHFSLAELNGAPDRHKHALKLLIEHARARGGCLYLREGAGLQLAAASAVDEPAPALEQELLRRIERAQALLQSIDALDGETRVFDSEPAQAPANDQGLTLPTGSGRPVLFSMMPAPAPPSEDAHRVVVLSVRMGGVSKPIGGAILMLEPGASVELDPRLLHAVAEALI
jgi:tetratricopeptide (TPR) repeat protein